ncbi:hypothetical protein Plhal304r1_c014g0051061 [Plasmopara halstedii]
MDMLGAAVRLAFAGFENLDESHHPIVCQKEVSQDCTFLTRWLESNNDQLVEFVGLTHYSSRYAPS